ncbi:LacI family DNA-binding transcriptional regulator [Victivallis vadensis]|uniref:LacI family DNA-binding transcriptional regulator n=1 Tax=Victivallis vadensis TaxID=172901 RepID=UPI00307DFDD9
MTSLKDIAQELGLSISVVSRALNLNPDANARIAPHTSQLIRETAARMGYRRNHAAEFMRRKRSAAIGVFVPEFSNRLIADLILGLHEETNLAGFSLQIHSGLDAASYRSFLADHNSLASTGIISYSPRQYHFPEQEEMLREYCASGGKVLMLNNPDEINLPVLSMDEAFGGALAAEVLMEHLECTDLLIFSTHDSIPYSVLSKRSEGFMNRIEKAKRTARQTVSLEEIIETVRHSSSGRCGVFADTDYQAWKLIHQARRAGVVPGRDFYLVGYDNLEFSAFTDPPLTTIHQEFREEGHRAIRILLKIIYNMDFEHSTLIRPTLVRRATA